MIGCDNAEENNKLEQQLESNDWKKVDIKFEYRSRVRPQWNAKVEKGFEISLNRGRIMLETTSILENKIYAFYKKAFKTAKIWMICLLLSIKEKQRVELNIGTREFQNMHRIW